MNLMVRSKKAPQQPELHKNVSDKLPAVIQEEEDDEDNFVAASKRFAASEIPAMRRIKTGDKFHEFNENASSQDGSSVKSGQRNTVKVTR